MDEGRVRASYHDNYDRLVKAEDHYDPDGTLHSACVCFVELAGD
jgi:hypothetical protein